METNEREMAKTDVEKSLQSKSGRDLMRALY